MNTVIRRKGRQPLSELSPIEYRLQSCVARLLAILGVKRICLAETEINGVKVYTAGDVEYFDGVEGTVVSLADALQKQLVDILAVIGVRCLEFELNDRERSDYTALWSGKAVSTIRYDEAPPSQAPVDAERTDGEEGMQKLVDAVGAMDAKDPESEDLVSKDPDMVSQDPEEERRAASVIGAVYDAVADMLPLEGRDYALNPTVKDSGVVGFKPLAYTEIGKLWLDYLSKNLGARLKKGSADVSDISEPASETEEKVDEG